MIMILFKSLGKRTSIGSYYDEKSLTKCYCPRPCWFTDWFSSLLLLPQLNDKINKYYKKRQVNAI